MELELFVGLYKSKEEMISGKDLKRMVDLIPDNALVLINGSWNCSVEGISIETSTDGLLASLNLTKGFSITCDKVIDEMFKDLRERYETR